MAFWKNDGPMGSNDFCSSVEDLLRAEIAKLRAERDKAISDYNDECDLVAKLSDLLGNTANALKGDPAPRLLHDWSDLPAVSEALRSALSAARAALDGEREACDEWASLFDLNIGAFIHKDEGTSFRQLWSNDESVRIARKHRARRAAEAQPKENQS